MFLSKGQTVKLNRTITIERDNGWQSLIPAGEGILIENVLAENEDGSLQVEVSADDMPLINPWDGSGVSDDEASVYEVLDIAESDLEA
jgi:hypothetical protein